MKPTHSIYQSSQEFSAPALKVDCPLNHGLAVLDQLMAGLHSETEGQALDLALELRFTLMESTDAEVIIRAFCQLRMHIEEAHYLACYRLRRWLEDKLQAIVSLDRCQPPLTLPVRLDHADISSIRKACLSAASPAKTVPAARVGFIFTPNTGV